MLLALDFYSGAFDKSFPLCFSCRRVDSFSAITAFRTAGDAAGGNIKCDAYYSPAFTRHIRDIVMAASGRAVIRIAARR